jgi:TldD protein
MLNRKSFLQLTSMSFGSLMVPSLLMSHPLQQLDAQQDPVKKALAGLALDAARSKGASYADVRISSTQGAGIRVLVNGRWGFASTMYVTNEGIAGCAETALAVAARSSAEERHQYDLKDAHDLWSCACFKR